MVVISPVHVVNEESSVNQISGIHPAVDNGYQIEQNYPAENADEDRGRRQNQRQRRVVNVANPAYVDEMRSEFEASEAQPEAEEEEANGQAQQLPPDQNNDEDHDEPEGRGPQQQIHQQRQVNRIYEHLKRSIFVPVLLVVTYIVFYIIPDQIHFWMHLANKQLSQEVLILFGILYPMSPISDAFIYIFFRRQSRRFLKRHLLRFLESIDLR